jgi:hypothetical protein
VVAAVVAVAAEEESAHRRVLALSEASFAVAVQEQQYHPFFGPVQQLVVQVQEESSSPNTDTP